jgi:sterol desaturase/sphingolipid hydroxylase (fatty acid hydroxylase superfamily)
MGAACEYGIQPAYHKKLIPNEILPAHPIEFLLSNVIPLTIGPLFGKTRRLLIYIHPYPNLSVQSHVMEIWYWVSIAILSTSTVHSGYSFPYSPFHPSDFHDLHHEAFNCNYGTIGLMDAIHNTGKYSRERK